MPSQEETLSLPHTTLQCIDPHGPAQHPCHTSPVKLAATLPKTRQTPAITLCPFNKRRIPGRDEAKPATKVITDEN